MYSQVTWFKFNSDSSGYTEVANGKKFNVHSNGSLSIANVQKEDDGTYMVEIVNNFGSAMEEIEVELLLQKGNSCPSLS